MNMKTPLKMANLDVSLGQKTYHEDGKFRTGDKHQYRKDQIDKCLSCKLPPAKCKGSDVCKEWRK